MPGERVLVVDDSPMNLKLVRILLSGDGFDVRCAADAEEAEFILQEFHPQLILMDIQLPGIDGLQLTRRLRKDPAQQGVVIVALTAYSLKGDEQRARDAGCNGYISKPIDTATFSDAVRSYLRQQARNTATIPSDSYDVLSELRNEFLTEGVEQSARLAATEARQWQPGEAERRLHRWAGLAGTLGFPAIGQKAREIEEMLGHSTAPEHLQPHFEELAQRFSGALRAKSENGATPLGIVALLAGKKIGMAGFAPSASGRIARAIEGAEGIPRLLAANDVDDQVVLQSLNLLVANVDREGDALAWIESDALAATTTAVLLIGPGNQLLASPLGQWRRPHDFVMAPWDPEEVVLRAYRLLAKSPLIRPSLSERNGRRSSVVVADDDPNMQTVIQYTLERFGVDCHVASDGAEALQLTQRIKPDAVVLDVRMPVLDGFDVLTSIRRNTDIGRVPVLMLTACNDEDDVIRGFGFGADDYLIKPFNPMELAARVTRLLPKQ